MRRLLLSVLLVAACAPSPGPPAVAAVAFDRESPGLVVMSPACRSYPIPQCGDWLTVESTTPTSATLTVERHETGRIAGYFYGLAPLQVSAKVYGTPRGGPIDHWVIEGIAPGPEWAFQVSEIGKDPRGCPLLLACAAVSFELSPFEEAR